MSKQINSVFDNMDMAEFARMRLKREGIDIESYNVRHIYDRRGSETDDTAITITPIFDNRSTNEALWAGSTGYQSFAGILLGAGSSDEQRTLRDDIYSDENIMSVRVPDDQVEIAKGIIRSCHGHSITVE